ncbi:malto-oligosyltrehalose trehalohydrolase [Sphingosinicella terrae]|uniref:malto-oligosyltrehalose trehalohydrolase n=1 Tax=Sphingosinicella terrae TaxID=2172047 RepID=UPI000E0CE418|nr:malto-oligosyltrehalose trehalohydrolase [Sphingosinicella terrae]
MPAAEAPPTRRLPIGAEIFGERTHLRVWAPARKRVEAVIEGGGAHALEPDGEGYFAGWIPGGAGTLYRFRLDEDGPFPDPASRFQPQGPHGPSEVVDPARFGWSDSAWSGVALDDAVIYEMHIGTFTREGSWAAAIGKLPYLAELGVTVLEVMPVAEFAGRFGWGYDGVDLFAPTRLYGNPDDMRRFVDAAHGLGLAVILDVVYNHIGPSGNYLPQFSKTWFTDKHHTDWGDALNFDDEGNGGVREYFTTNAHYWIEEYHLDGLRLDATPEIRDDSEEHVLVGIGRAVREAGAGRTTLVIAENERQEARIVRPRERGGYGLDAIWNDDFHHSALVAATGHNEAYYRDHVGSPQELLSAAKWGFLFQGQYYAWQRARRGHAALDLPPSAIVNFLQNHDQIANTPLSLRGHELTSPGRWRALTAMLLLMPGTPLLFQGQEFLASAPFLYFADHEPELAALVEKGRGEFMRQFPSLAEVDLPAPHDRATFERCRLDHGERERGAHAKGLRMHRDLLRIRREDKVLRIRERRQLDGAVIGAEALLLRWFGERGDDRLLLVNLGRDYDLPTVAEPLLAPPEDRDWSLVWSSENPAYGGRGTVRPQSEDGSWHIAGHSALLLRADGTASGRRS